MHDTKFKIDKAFKHQRSTKDSRMQQIESNEVNFYQIEIFKIGKYVYEIERQREG